MNSKLKNGYTIIEVTVIVIFLSFILSITTNIKTKRDESEILSIISQLEHYKTQIKLFKKIYGYFPGDVNKTQVFELSKNNTDGNQNNLIEDLNQMRSVKINILKSNGEVLNFWQHLSKLELMKNYKINDFPYIDEIKTKIIVFSDEKNNYFHLSIFDINKDNEFETVNNFTPYQAYLLDNKIDDGYPMIGNVMATGGNKINPNKLNNKINRKCATNFEYLTFF